MESNDGGHFKDTMLGEADYQTYSFDYDGNKQSIPDPRLNQFKTGIGGNSILQVTLYGGSALAVSSEELDLVSAAITKDYKTGKLAGSGVKDVSTYIYLTPAPPQIVAGEIITDPVAGRSLRFSDSDDDIWVRLIEVGLTMDATGMTYESGVNDATGTYSQNQKQASQDGTFSRDTVTVERYGNGVDPEDHVFTITIVEDNDEQTWTVNVNGVLWAPGQNEEPFYSLEEAEAKAAETQIYFEQNILPLAYRKEIQELTPEPEGFQWSWDNPVVKWGTIALGVVIVGFVIYTFTRTAATEATKRGAGTS